jgi:hypothetical protein
MCVWSGACYFLDQPAYTCSWKTQIPEKTRSNVTVVLSVQDDPSNISIDLVGVNLSQSVAPPTENMDRVD